MLRGKGFTSVYNLSGGIKGATAAQAQGPPELGLHLFSGTEDIREVIIIGLGLEHGLQEFYLQMIDKTKGTKAADLFAKLAEVEVIHQNRLVDLYQKTTGENVELDALLSKVVTPAMEGGLTTEEYLKLYSPDLESLSDIFSLAMGIEAQALDLYQRASGRASNDDAVSALGRMASEEREHMAKLAEYIDNMETGD